MFTRRDFIKTMSLLSGAVLAPVRWMGKWAGVEPAGKEERYEGGELYAGFVLLSDGDPVPDFVRSPKRKFPILCNVGGNVEITGMIEEFNNIEEIISKLKFLVYKLGTPMTPVGGYVLSHKSGEIFGVEQGIHTHMGRDTAGVTQAYSCCAGLTQGSSWIYRWSWEDGVCAGLGPSNQELIK